VPGCLPDFHRELLAEIAGSPLLDGDRHTVLMTAHAGRGQADWVSTTARLSCASHEDQPAHLRALMVGPGPTDGSAQRDCRQLQLRWCGLWRLQEVEEMSLTKMNAQTAEVLGTVPRGSLPQNMYRSAVQQLTMNSLGRNAQIQQSWPAIHEAAVRAVRVYYPAFTPTVRHG
jgi:hypothetical protein